MINTLTICLVTRGREDFLHECLSNLEIFAENQSVKILIIDNGSKLPVSNQLEEWAKSNKAEFVRFSQNDTRANKVWEVLRNRDTKWVLFPGDDDIVLPAAVSRFLKIVNEEPNLNGVCFNIQEFSGDGKLSSVIRKPLFKESQGQGIQLACAFHEPAFLWPSLFLNIHAVPEVLPTSRYVFDWWTGIQLILKGGIKSVDEVAVNYRIHSQQESNLANLRRKFFEASFWLSDLIESEIFTDWLESQSAKQVSDFWKQLNLQTPVYGNNQFGFVIEFSLAKRILRIKKFQSLAEKIVSDLSANQGVFLKKGDLRNLLPSTYELSSNTQSNIPFQLVGGSCHIMQNAASYLSSEVETQCIKLGCKHSYRGQIDLEVDCFKLEKLDSGQAADLILVSYINKLEEAGNLQLILTTNESKLINLLRRYQNRIPGFAKHLTKNRFSTLKR